MWEVSARPELCGACSQLSVETVDSGAMPALIAGHSCRRAFVAANEKVSGAGEPAALHFVVIQSGETLAPTQHDHFNRPDETSQLAPANAYFQE